MQKQIICKWHLHQSASLSSVFPHIPHCSCSFFEEGRGGGWVENNLKKLTFDFIQFFGLPTLHVYPEPPTPHSEITSRTEHLAIHKQLFLLALMKLSEGS